VEQSIQVRWPDGKGTVAALSGKDGHGSLACPEALPQAGIALRRWRLRGERLRLLVLVGSSGLKARFHTSLGHRPRNAERALIEG